MPYAVIKVPPSKPTDWHPDLWEGSCFLRRAPPTESKPPEIFHSLLQPFFFPTSSESWRRSAAPQLLATASILTRSCEGMYFNFVPCFRLSVLHPRMPKLTRAATLHRAELVGHNRISSLLSKKRALLTVVSPSTFKQMDIALL